MSGNMAKVGSILLFKFYISKTSETKQITKYIQAEDINFGNSAFSEDLKPKSLTTAC